MTRDKFTDGNPSNNQSSEYCMTSEDTQRGSIEVEVFYTFNGDSVCRVEPADGTKVRVITVE